jgi:HlyD family secretion protein
VRPDYLVVLFGIVITAGCEQELSLDLPGSTEWDRNAVLAEASEPVIAWYVSEGDRVDAGTLLLELDGARQDARIDDIQAQLAQAEARLDELRNGPRLETIATARANVDSAEAAARDAELEYERVAELLRRELISESSVDQALATRDQRRAAIRAAQASLAELLAGTRAEEIAQAEAAVASYRAQLNGLKLTRQRLSVRAPRSGRIDALPFKPGDQPGAGDEVASLLVGDRPYARVFVSSSVRPRLVIGDEFEVRVEGIAEPFHGTLQRIRSEPSFTPYYALTGDDASRLVYRAEIRLEDQRAADLPAGLPLVAAPIQSGQ